MYELEYVRKRKRKKRAAIIGGISMVVISALSIVAFLGRFVGTFTVSLDTGNVKLTLSETSDFAESTSYIRVSDMPHFQEYTYSYIQELGDAALDSEDSDYTIGGNKNSKGEIKSLNFFKITFYVKNVGDTPCQYTFSLNIDEKSASTDGRYLDETLRVLLYENKNEEEHNYKIYGKRMTIPRLNEEGQPDYRPPVTIEEDDATVDNPFMGYAEVFQSSKVITSFSVQNFHIGEVRKYTIVTWLEGFRSSNLEDAPEGASIKLGVKINAYEI